MDIDFILHYINLDTNKLSIFPATKESLKKVLNINSESTLIEFLNYYLSTTDSLKIIKIYKHVPTYYEEKDFEKEIIQRRKYGENFPLFYVRVKNLKTGVIFQDWLRPDQYNSINILNKIIFWERKGEEITISS